MMNHFQWREFATLSSEEVYAILALRSEVFVVEQQCFYLDPDGKDKDALHLMGMDDGKLVAYLRLFLPIDTEDNLVFGRILTAQSVRSKGLGKQLMQELIGHCETYYSNRMLQCSAQYYLKSFYESFGFVVDGEVYEDAGVPHINMNRMI